MKNIRHTLAGALLPLLISGCITDPSYDLTKLDTEITVLKGEQFSFPDIAPVTLDDLFNLESIGYITCDDNGDYAIRFALDPASFTVFLPEADADGRLPLDFQPVEYQFGDVPGFLGGNGQDIVPDLSRMTVRLDVENGIPAEMEIGATLETLRGGTATHRYDIDALPVSSGTSTLFLVESPQYFGDYAVPELGKILSPVPDAVRVSNLDARLKMETVPSGVSREEGYPLTVRTSFEVPLCFAADSRFTFTIPLNVSLNLKQIGLKTAVLSFAYENAIPLDLEISLYALDADGQPLEGIRVEGSDCLFGRSSGMADLCLTTRGDLRFNDLVLQLTASSNESIAGTVFNKDQGIRLSDLLLYLPDGIQVRIDQPENDQ